MALFLKNGSCHWLFDKPRANLLSAMAFHAAIRHSACHEVVHFVIFRVHRELDKTTRRQIGPARPYFLNNPSSVPRTM